MPDVIQHETHTPDQDLSAVLENYLEIIFRLELRDGAARASAIAEAANVSRSTVTSALKTLKSQGYVEYTPYSLIHLTDTGLAIGRDIAHRHLVFEEFFHNVLECDSATADSVACALEHVVPPDVIRRLGQFILFLENRKEFWEGWQQAYKVENMAAKHVHPHFSTRGKVEEDENPYI